MLYSEFYGKLIILTKLNNITHADIAKCIKKNDGALFARAKRNSKMSFEEIKTVEEKFNVDIFNLITFENSLERQFDNLVQSKHKNFGVRLSEIQNKNSLSSIQMASILGLSEKDFFNLINGSTLPELFVLDNIKQNFKVSVDWLLYGE